MAPRVPFPPPGFDDLSADEKIDYLELLWSRIAATLEAPAVPEWHREVIAERLRDLESKPREMVHDSQVYRAYLRAADRLREEGAEIRRVRLDYELKREYQRFLQERNRGRRDSDGRPDREEWEIAAWAREHELPYEDGHVKFRDARIEYDARDGRSRFEDVEVMTLHYRGAMGASKAQSGFTCYRGGSIRIGGRSGGRGGRPFDARVAEEVLG
jgi:hypothetical protein